MLNAAINNESIEDLQLQNSLLSAQLLKQQEVFEVERKKFSDEISDKIAQIVERDTQIELLAKQILLAKRFRYGRSSEKISAEVFQTSLFNEAEVEAEIAATLNAPEEQPRAPRKRGVPKRSPIPEDLPRRDVIVELNTHDRECPTDGSQMAEISREVSEKLNIIPAKIEVVRTIRITYGCLLCKENIRSAALPAHILPKSLADVGLLALIVVSKFVDGVPLYRIEKILSRIGAEIPRSTMAAWVIAMGSKFIVLTNLMKELLLEGDHLFSDETHVQVLNKEGHPVKCKDKDSQRGWMWVTARAGPDPIVLYEYHAGRNIEAAKQVLDGFKGYLQVDGYASYDWIFKDGTVIRVGCWAHVRRKFHDAWIALKKPRDGLAFEVLQKIQRLFVVEEKNKNESPKTRFAARISESEAILAEIRFWLDGALNKSSKKSPTGKALQYLDNQWPSLITFLKDGRLEIHNNFVENKIRPFAIGRKNWLFSASVAGAESSAALYSLAESAKANGIEPYDYIHWLLEQFPLAQSVDDFTKLLPHNAKHLIKTSYFAQDGVT